MKSQLKGLIIGLLAGIFIMSGITAFAVAGDDALSTLYNVKVGGVRIVIDGKEYTPTDANGNAVQPMIYNGTTYLPVRAVSNAFGKAVYWDGEESTVYLGKMDGKLKAPTVKLEDVTNMSYEKGGFEVKKNVFDNYGDFYSYAINNDDFWTNRTGTIFEGLLKKEYSIFKATLFVPKGANWEENPYITVVGDDKILYTSEEMSKTSQPIEVEVDVSNVNDFKIIFSHYNCIYIANAGFYQ